MLSRQVEQLKQKREWQGENEQVETLNLIDEFTPIPNAEKLAAAVLAELEFRAGEERTTG